MPLTLDLTPIADRFRREAEKLGDVDMVRDLDRVKPVLRTVEVGDDVVERAPWIKELDAQRLAEGQVWYCEYLYAMFDGRFTAVVGYEDSILRFEFGNTAEASIKLEFLPRIVSMTYLTLDVDIQRGELQDVYLMNIVISTAEAKAILMHPGASPRLAAMVMVSEWEW